MLMGKADKPFSDPGWSYEVKFDGWRAIVQVSRRGVRVWTRHGRDVTVRFPELQQLRGDVAGAAILDAELVMLDVDGRPRFEWLSGRRRPATIVAFDVLRVGRRDVVALPLRERRDLLAAVVPADTAAVLRSRVFTDGFALLERCEDLRLEGIVAKRDDAPYRVAQRSDEWRKIRTKYGAALIRDRMRNSQFSRTKARA
jgi:bifunctional non-homologous end joining protein LigD